MIAQLSAWSLQIQHQQFFPYFSSDLISSFSGYPTSRGKTPLVQPTDKTSPLAKTALNIAGACSATELNSSPRKAPALKTLR